VTVMGQPARAHGRTIPVTCQTHGGGRGYCNLRIRKVNDAMDRSSPVG
jgi:hypothetical protein